MKTIDITPSWEAVLPVYINAITEGTEKGMKAAVQELTRMAQLADKYVEVVKKQPKDESSH